MASDLSHSLTFLKSKFPQNSKLVVLTPSSTRILYALGCYPVPFSQAETDSFRHLLGPHRSAFPSNFVVFVGLTWNAVRIHCHV